MTYAETIDFLYAQLPQYQKIGGKAIKTSLGNIKILCQLTGNPQNEITTIHIAGTNGKGSTTSLLASVLIESGYKVGVFTSPHLIDFRERITINGKKIEQQYIVDFVKRYKSETQSIQPSFFEWTMALAFNYFYDKKVDVAVIETGLGGRLDSSNIITPLVSVITTIGLEHTQYLGNTYREIAFEKGGIIKQGVPCVIGYGLNDEAKNEIIRIGKERQATIFEAQPLTQEIPCGLLGEVQQYNIATVLKTIEQIKSYFPKITEKYIHQGLINVNKNTLLRGRWEIVGEKPRTVFDIAHNTQAVKAIVKQLTKESYNQLHIVWGMVSDKNIAEIIQYLPQDAHYYLCQPDIERAMPVEHLQNYFATRKTTVFKSCFEAYKKALTNTKQNDLILVSGSNFVVSEVMNVLQF